MENLTIEAFKGIGYIKPLKFYEYSIVPKCEIDNIHKILGQARYKMHSYNNFKAVFVKNHKLYALEKLSIPKMDNMEINFNKSTELGIENNLDIYKEVVIYYINNSLRQVRNKFGYKKYITKYTDEIICNTIIDRDLSEKYQTQNGIYFKRKFKINPEVLKNGEVILYISCSSDFSTQKTIFDFINEKKDIIGLTVKNKWSNIKGTGEIVEISDRRVGEVSPELGVNLIEYYKNMNQAYRVNQFTEEDKNANVIKVKTGKKIYEFIPHSLEPIITREYLKKYAPNFSIKIEPLLKMEMSYRYVTLKSFINDIGSIKELNDIKFIASYFDDVSKLGYSKGIIEEPILLSANGIIKNKINVFSKGFYKISKQKVNFGVIYPEGEEIETQKTIRAIFDFLKEGKYHKEENKYIKKNLLYLNFDKKECIYEEYKAGDIIDYKKAALRLKEYSSLSFIIAIIPNIEDDENENPYNPFKRVWAELGIPSQMVSLKTAERFVNSTSKTELYYLHNIALGILGKIGGVPWGISNMPGDIDCFIGLDVGTREKGIHNPACSVVFDKYGELINYYKPTIPQSGEIIQTEILQEIFDKILLSYEEKYGRYPKNIMIHRDGFSREDLDWYKNYFDKKSIDFTIVEIKKNILLKIAEIKNGEVKNPKAGSYILKEDKAYLITTDIRENLGSPRPLKIEKIYGKAEMMTILKQIYFLANVHVGSTKALRLPITVGYADKICKAIDFIPSGVLDNRLFFL